MTNDNLTRPWHGGDLTGARKRYGRAPQLDFSANINPLGLPPAVVQELPGLLNNLVVHYPDPFARPVKEALAAHLGVTPDNLLLGNGSIEIIYLLPRLLGISRAAVPTPGFSEYAYGAQLAGATIRSLPLSPPDYTWDLEAITATLPHVDMLFLCNPNNPTGSLFTAAQLAALTAALPPRDAFLVMDEAFIDFVTDQASLTLVHQAVQDPRLVVLGSLTKFFALPGLRLGYLVGQKDLIARIAAHLPPWNINSLAQAAALLALQDAEFIRLSRTSMAAARHRFFAALAQLPGLAPLPPTANFIFCRLTHPTLTAPRLTDLLGRRGFLIRDCSNYPGLDDRCIRLAVRRPEDNAALVAALEEILHGRD